MTVSRDVILDLLPLYLSDEASQDTRTLVEQHLADDADLARLAKGWKERLPEAPPAAVSPDAEALAYREAKRQIAQRVITLAAAIAFTILSVAGVALVAAMFLLAR